MALPRTSLRGFLTHARYTLQTAAAKKTPVTFVVGNESADLDSICSAIVYSYIASISPAQAGKPRVFHIPLINLPKVDIGLRPELLALLPKANITREHLITLDDLGDSSTLTDRFPPANTRWILVDHNKLPGRLGELYGESVVGVVDHHQDEGSVPEDTGDEARIITPCGSCASLVVNYWRRRWDEWFLWVSFSGAANGQGDNLIEDGSFATLWDAQLAHLALASILIDTTNLENKHKTTPEDREAVEYLESKIKMSSKMGKGYNRQELYRLISEAKASLDSLDIQGILRKDYKEWSEAGMVLGISSVVKPHSYLESKTANESGRHLVDECRAYAANKNLTIMSVLTAFANEDGVFQRELSLLSNQEKGRKVIEGFAEGAGKELKLKQTHHSDDDGWLCMVWDQGDLASSRKQVAPLLRSAMSSV